MMDSLYGLAGTLVYGLGMTGAGLLAVAGSTDAAQTVLGGVLELFEDDGPLTVPLFDL